MADLVIVPYRLAVCHPLLLLARVGNGNPLAALAAPAALGSFSAPMAFCKDAGLFARWHVAVAYNCVAAAAIRFAETFSLSCSDHGVAEYGARRPETLR
jgi:hypothetical protein